VGARRIFAPDRGSDGVRVQAGGRSLVRLSVLPAPTVRLDDRLARELPELAVPWEAAQPRCPACSRSTSRWQPTST
jgi:hypothetical protein